MRFPIANLLPFKSLAPCVILANTLREAVANSPFLTRERRRFMQQEKRSVTPEKVIKILAEYGTKVSLEEAKLMLDFLYKFAKLTLEHVLKR